MGTNCSPHVADLFGLDMRVISCCLYKTIIKLILLRLLSPPPDTCMTYLILIVLILNQMVGQIYPIELQLNKVNSSLVLSKIYDNRDDFNFE